VTWADPGYLEAFRNDIARLRDEVDIVVASCHWGLWQDVLNYTTEIAYAAIDAGADIVMGHGPHYSLPVEIYRGKPIFYGLGSFSFHTGHSDGVDVGDWVGMLVRIDIEDRAVAGASFKFVRHNSDNETVPCQLCNEAAILEELATRSAPLGAKLAAHGDEVVVELGA
jgi:poly-gamma-glutamate synthesis protein (capsule biosynthesis protein)